MQPSDYRRQGLGTLSLSLLVLYARSMLVLMVPNACYASNVCLTVQERLHTQFFFAFVRNCILNNVLCPPSEHQLIIIIMRYYDASEEKLIYIDFVIILKLQTECAVEQAVDMKH